MTIGLSIDNVDDSNFSCCPGSIQISYSDTYFLIFFMFFSSTFHRHFIDISSTFHRFQGLKLGQATQRCAESQAAIEELKPESLVFNQLPQSKNPTRKFEMEKPQGKCTRKLKMKPFKILSSLFNCMQILLWCRFHPHFSPRPISDVAGRDSNLSKDCCDCTSHATWDQCVCVCVRMYILYRSNIPCIYIYIYHIVYIICEQNNPCSGYVDKTFVSVCCVTVFQRFKAWQRNAPFCCLFGGLEPTWRWRAIP